MKKVAKFYKVSFEQFEEDFRDCFTVKDFDKYDGEDLTSAEIRKIWEEIERPKRGTTGSAGYDFVTPLPFELRPGERIKIPTGIRVAIDEGYVLKMYVRSSVGFKYEVCLTNGTGIIDSDYFYADNEGHIFVKLRNDGTKDFVANAGDRVVQGIFCKYAITKDDTAATNRTGGIGSTGK